MFCTNCKQARVENEVPCPHCGAPSALLQLSGVGQWGTNNSGGAWTASSLGLRKSLQMNSWGGPVTNEVSPIPTTPNTIGVAQEPLASEPWGTPAPQPTFGQGMPIPSTPTANWPQMSPATSSQSMSAWPDNEAERQAPSQALLPVLYQGPQANDMRTSTVALQIISQDAIEHLLPEIADVPEPVYVSPLFPNARPLIPRYRIVSGTLSVLIVVLMLCGGVGYYAQASGTLGHVVRMFTNQSPPSVQVTPSPRLPDPPNQIDTGPALGFIPSGTTTLRIDPGNLPLETDKVFTVNQPFYVTYTVQPGGQQGKVSVKWYMNNKLYNVVTSNPVPANQTSYGSHQMQYLVPAEGSVEIYWNDLLALRFYFVVQPVR